MLSSLTVLSSCVRKGHFRAHGRWRRCRIPPSRDAHTPESKEASAVYLSMYIYGIMLRAGSTLYLVLSFLPIHQIVCDALQVWRSFFKASKSQQIRYGYDKKILFYFKFHRAEVKDKLGLTRKLLAAALVNHRHLLWHTLRVLFIVWHG